LSTPSRLDRFRGCLLGGAVGDALGGPVEFMSGYQIQQRYGAGGIQDFDLAYGRRGAITDDTQMTLFTAEGLIRADQRFRDRGICNVPDVVRRAYLRWLHTQGEPIEPERFYPGSGPDGWLASVPALHARRAPGNTCLSALRTSDPDAVLVDNSSKGCGGVMRVAPVGLVARDAFELGCDLAQITHGHPSGYLAAGYLAELIHGLVEGLALDTALDLAHTRLAQQAASDECTNAIAHARDLAALQAPPSADRLTELGEGWVAEEALAIAIYCALVGRDFAEGVVLAVNHGGDSDSTGAMTGNILGTATGVDAIPERWLAELELRDEIDQLAHDLHAIADADDLALDTARYPTY
jgi:ADP-ribosylglycohydrolase